MREDPVNTTDALKRLVSNDLENPADAIFALGPQFKPSDVPQRLAREPLSFIIGEHPSGYSMSPFMWSTERQLSGREELFLPADVAPQALEEFLRLALKEPRRFRVLTITNPYKIDALRFFVEEAKRRANVSISEDALRIGATNQVLVGPDGIFHVINSDGRGMVRAIESHLAALGRAPLGSTPVALVGAGGAARGIAYELAKKLDETGGRLHIFNRTPAKAAALAEEFSPYYPRCALAAHPLEELLGLAGEFGVVVSSITKGDPLADGEVYRKFGEGALIVDANYGANSVLARNARAAGREDLAVFDGAGMVVEGYIIPSRELAALWGYQVPERVYQEIGALFGYKPRAGR